jgi:sugar lactone lactonase YvrE
VVPVGADASARRPDLSKFRLHRRFSLQTARHALRDSLFCLWLLAAALPVAVLGQVNYATPYTVTPLAGYDHQGSWDGTGSAAQFDFSFGVAVDSSGNVYVGDQSSHTIRKVTPAGVVTTLAGSAGNMGSADGTGSAARFNYPGGVALDTNGNLYVGDWGNNTIRKVTPAGVVTTLAGLAGSFGTNDGMGSAAQFNGPDGVAVDSAGNVYVADSANDTIRKVTPVGVVTTLAGSAGSSGANDGMGSAAQFNYPLGVAVDSASNVYVGDYGNGTIRKVTPTGVVTTLAGSSVSYGTNDGTGTNALFNGPWGVAVDAIGNVYVADTDNMTIRKVTSAGIVTTLAGSTQFDPGGAQLFGSADGTNGAAQFYYPDGVAVDGAGNLYVADANNCLIRKVTPVGKNWVVTTLAGSVWYGSADGTGSAARFNYAHGLAVDSAGNVYVADSPNYTVRKVTPAGVVTTLVGLAGVFGTNDGTGSAARFERPECVAIDTNGNLYVTDIHASTIRKVTAAGVVTTLAGSAGNSGTNDGTGANALFNSPWGVALDSAGNVYVADSGNDTIRKVTPAGVVTTLAGSAGNYGYADATGTNALFGGPEGLGIDSTGNLYVADSGNNAIRKVTPAGVVTTLAGSADKYGYADATGTNALFSYPWGVAVDSAGNVYVTDFNPATLRKVTPAGVVTTLAGLPNTNNAWQIVNGGIADGTGSAARFNYTSGVAVDSAGNIYLMDICNNNIRKAFPASSVPPPLLRQVSLSAGQFGFGITGLTNLAVDIESSADLSNWQVVSTLILEGGSNSFATPNPSLGAQFYRGHVR